MTKKLMTARRFIAAGVLSAFMFIGIASVNAQNISDGLIAYWPFDTDLQDAVGDSHGEGMGSEDIAFSQGQWGSGIELDGVDQYVETPLDNEEMFDFQDGTGFSISAWYKVGEFTKSWQALIAKGEGNRWRIHRRGGENILTGNGGNGDVPAGTPDINDGELHHIVLVSDPENDEVRLYSDGELSSSNNAPAIQSNENPMMIGENPDARNRTWSGIIDDVGIWNRPLTEDEIAQLGESSIGNLIGGGELVPGLIAYWPFDNAAEIEDSQVVVDLIGGLEGEVNGDGIVAGEGFLGGAIDFAEDATDGSVTIEYVNDWLAAASDADQLSVSLWQKLHAVRSTSTFWFSADSAPGGMRNYQAHIPWGNSNIYFDTAGCCGGGDTRIAAAGGIDFLEWHNYVFIKDGENKSIYIDGELFLEGVNTAPLFDDWGTTYLGVADSGAAANRLAGLVDDFGVWARAITPEEVATIYNGGSGSPLYSAGGGPRIVGKFSADWTDDVEPEGTYMAGVTEVGDEFLHITDAANGANGAFTIEDFSRGAVFTDFEMSFRLHMSDSTCCGSGDDSTAAHRPADGMSINIGNDLPDTIGLAEEGSGSGIRICFDTWDSGGGEAPAIDVWRGAEGEVGDGNQDGWSGGMLVRQNFNGVTGATEEDKFKDENGDYVWMWTQGEWVDVKISVLDGMFTINYKGHEVISHALPAAWAPLVGPNWLFAARTGGANSTHWIDDLNITLYGSTAPGVSMFEADAGGWRLKITDIEEAAVELDTVEVTYEGEVIDLAATKADGVTSIEYVAPEPLLANSDHALQVSFKDSNGKNQLLNLDFGVKDFSLVDPTLRVPDSAKGDSGFLVYTTQISTGQGVGSLHGNQWSSAEKQIRGGYIDPDTEEQYLNEADLDSFDVWSYMPAWVEVVNQNQDAPAAVGNFNGNNGYEDEPIPGIPGWGDSTDGIASEYVTMLELTKGAYKLGVNSDDGFNASFGVSYPDAFQQNVGQFNGGRGASDTTFEIYVLEDGLYPFRVAWWEGGGGANIEIFSFVEIDGKSTKVLINDPGVEGSIKAFAPKGVTLDETTSERATTGRAYIAGVFPGDGAFSTAKNVGLTVVNGNVSSLDQGSVKVSFDGEVVSHKVNSDGDARVISYDASSGENGKHTALVEFADSDGGTRSVEWSFTLADPIEEGQLNLLAHWGFDEELDASESIDSMNGLAAVFESNAKLTADSIRGNALDTTAGGARALVAEGAFLNLASSINQVTYTFWLKWNGNRVASSAFWAYSPSSPSGRRGAQAHVPWGGGAIYWDTAGCCGGGDTRIASDWGGDYHTWNHFAFIKNEDLKQIFINGELFHEGENTAPLPMDFNQLHIMSGENGGNRTAGLMDDFAVFASALDEEQLADVMTGKLLGAELSSDLIAVQPTDISAEMNQTATFSLELTSDEGASVLWKMNGVNIGSGTSVETGLLTEDDNGAKVQAVVMSADSYQESTLVTLTVTADKTAPVVVSSDGSRYMNTLKLVYSEEMDEGAVGSYTVAGLSVDSAELIGTNTVILSTDEQTPGKVYTVSVSGAKDPSGNAFNGDVTIQAYVESTGYLWWDYWGGIGGAHPMENLTDSENYPDNPDSSQLLPWTNSRWAVGFHNNAHENYGARASGWLVAPEDGEYRIWLRSDDHGQVWISLDEDPENVELIAEQVGCCNGFTLDDGGLSGIVELEEGQRYYFEALLKEGGGGDWMNVGWTLPSDEDLDAPPWNDGGISGEHFVNFIPATGTRYTGDAEIYHAGTKAPESGGVGTNNGGGLLVREFQGIGGASLGDLLTNAKWPNSPDLVTWSNHAEWPQNESGDINDLPANGGDNYATQLLGFVHPPETGEYQFFVAADDMTALFLSTDETPENKRLIAIEPNWNGVREFGQGRNRVVVDNDTGRQINGSVPISLEAGKAYFIEAITKEGGGGDNLAITWIRAGDDLPVDGALPISGDHLSPWLVEPPPPSAVDNGDGTITFETHLAWEWWDGIGGAHPMESLTDNARYPDSPDGATFAPSWNTRTALAGGFEGNGRENYGGRMSGVLTAPESGTYRFFIASDDHGLLRISTDADPANAVRVAEQTGCCNNFTLDDGGLSGTVDLVAGNQYYMESLLKEGGGGDWMTVAWRMPSEDIDSVPGGNQDGISGEYFTGTVTVNENLPALSSSLSPGDGAVGMVPNPTFTLNVSNGATTLDADSVSISLDGNKLEHTATEGSWSRSYSVVSQEFKTYSITASSAKLAGSSEHTVSATFTDSAGTETTYESSFTVTDNLVLLAEAGTVKYIEAEDFNYDGGSWMTFEEVGTGGAYDGLGAEMGVDLNNAGNNSPKYRVIDPHPGMTESMWDSSRNGFDMDVDFKMGWNGGGEWWNYTRDFAEEDTYYHVYGRFSSGGGAINNKLSIVTSDATTADQTLEDVGVFQGPATGGWNNMKFFPMTDSQGNLGVVKIGGVTTVRLSMMGGAMDANYLAFVKAAVQSYPPLLVSTSPSGAADSSAVIQAVLKKRDIDLADASITVNGAAANVDVATDGDTITLTVSGNPSELGNNDVSLSYNGQTTEWSYFYYGDQYTEDGLNLLASWDFNEGTVDSVSGHEGVLVGGATLTEGSLDVRAAGNSAMLVEDAVFMNIASAMNKLTVAFWQNSASIPSTSSFWAYSPSTGAGGRAAQGHVPWSNGHIYWDTAGCCGGDTRIEKLWEGDWSTWNHFAFVKNGDTKEIWINGELHHSGSNNGVLPGDISRLAVGAMIDSATSQGGNSANSQIDDFKVFAQGLTQDQIRTLAGLPADISAPGNAVVPSSTEHPAGEHPGLAIDNDSSTKYLNFDKLDTGLTITTGGGVVTGLGLTSANDGPERDPASFVLSGSNDGGATFTEIAAGDIAAFGARFERQEVSFDNSTAYTTYQVTFPTVANADAANSMQIAEIELLGTAAEAQPEPEAPALSIVNNGDGTVTVTFEGKLEAAASVNGPWQDSGLTSPATINSDQVQQYGRAVRE